jgi:hypothetical protein
MSDFDDAPRWYWAAAETRSDGEMEDRAGDRFVIACGQRELWSRVRREIDRGERCAWNGFGPDDGKATLADCMYVFLQSREMYGANYNRLTLEMAQIPAFARFVKDAPSDLCNWVSNPTAVTPIPREGYDRDIHAELGRRIAVTLDLPEDWWR